MLKYRILLIIVIFAVIAAAGHSQVNQDELLQDLPYVVFINFEGPHHRFDTREQIRQLGVVLGAQVAAHEGQMAPVLAAMTTEERRAHSSTVQFGTLNRYFVIHSVSPPEDGRLDAVIFGLGVDTAVDHIRNLRWIIQGYLQAAYGYSESDAALLAEYITIYNAVYRNNWEYFESRFKTSVMDNLVRGREGISIRFDEWPGRTMMLIPLGHGGLNAIDAGAIADRRVIEELRREDDFGVPQRQGMVDLLERQAEEAERMAEAEREAIRQQEAALEQQRQQAAEAARQAEQERQQIAEERQALQEEQAAGLITEEEAALAQQELDAREEALAQQEQAIEERAQEIAQMEEAIEERREEAERLEEFAEARFEQAQQHREEIAQDQQIAIVMAIQGGVFGVSIERQNPTSLGRITRMSLDGRVLRRSPLDNVHTRTVTLLGGRILAIAGDERSAVRLVEINENTLDIARQGDDDIMMGSLLWVNGNDLYAITVSDGNHYMGRFNTNLELQAISETRIHPSAALTIQQGRLLTQRDDGSPVLLNPANLIEVR